MATKKRKLLPCEKVEVRSLEDGFLGSWHIGTVVTCKKLIRIVRYDHLLNDEGSNNITEKVNVTSAIDGVFDGGCGTSKNYRGLIRPLPPSSDIGASHLYYGQCVDMFYEDAWWEGVIFDHEDGSEKRRIFFPDLGDELEGRVDILRESKDWDEVTGKWKPRGNWLFLELIDEIKQDWPLPVSVKQIWYEVRMINDFQNLEEWTSPGKNIWREIVQQVFFDYLRIFVKQFFVELELDTAELRKLLLKFSDEAFDKVVKSEGRSLAVLPRSIAVLPFEGTFQSCEGTSNIDVNDKNNHSLPGENDQVPMSATSAMFTNKQALFVSNLPNLSHNSHEYSGIGYNNFDEAPAMSFKFPETSTVEGGHQWQPAVPELISGAEYHPNIIGECNKILKEKKRPPSELMLKTSKHLLHLGWKIEFMRDHKNLRRRYFSPDGNLFYSFRQVCVWLSQEFQLESGSEMMGQKMHVGLYDKKLPCPPGGKSSEASSELSKSCTLSDELVFEPEYCPDSVRDYYSLSLQKKFGGGSSSEAKDIAKKAKKHLSALGWHFYYHQTKKTREVRYLSALGISFNSLVSACKWCVETGDVSPLTERMGNVNSMQDSDNHLSENNSPVPLVEMECSEDFPIENGKYKNMQSSDFSTSKRGEVHKTKISIKRKNLECSSPQTRRKSRASMKVVSNMNVDAVPVSNMNVEIVSNINVDAVPASNMNAEAVSNMNVEASPQTRRKSRASMRAVSNMNVDAVPVSNMNAEAVSNMNVDAVPAVPVSNMNAEAVSNMNVDAVPAVPVSNMNAEAVSNMNVEAVRRSSKRVRERIASLSQQTPRTVLSWLIDNNAVLPREKVQYCGRKNGVSMAEGRVAREGIKCSCCGEMFSLNNFELHAGSSSHRPSAHIFLEDGRSLLECQMLLKRRERKRYSRSVQGNRRNRKNDYLCSVCHYGGALIMCDQCPSSFHIQCLGLKGVPEGLWFCPTCCCKICGKTRLDGGNGQITDSFVLTCGQCERRYHAGCLRNKGFRNRYSERFWFCQDTCEQIFSGLRKILGKKVLVGTDNLSWTLVKYIESDPSDHEAFDDEDLVETHSKLNVALSVMHECFEPVKEPNTRRDLVEDVIFSRWSQLNRLNFEGFYTILLEKNDELISAATVRIYGKEVAEIPLVATRFQYRRHGMCRILMNELEKKLTELGVERLVLPAVPSVLNTWITSFGFSRVNELQRLNFLDYTFLDFQGTIFCQKVIRSRLPLLPSLFADMQAEGCEHMTNNVIIELDEKNAVSELNEKNAVSEGQQVGEENGIVQEELGCIKMVAGNENVGCSAQMAVVVYESTPPDGLTFESKTSLGIESNDKQSENNKEGILKCYKRRRISVC